MGITLRYRTLKDKSKSYYLDYFINGKRWKEGLDLVASRGNSAAVKEQAENILSSRRLEYSAGNHGVVAVTAKTRRFDAYFRDYAKNYTKGDGNAVRACYSKFMEFLGNKPTYQKTDGRKAAVYSEEFTITFGQLTEKRCEEFKKFLLSYRDEYGEPLKGETPVNYWAKFKKVIRASMKDKLIRAMPTQFISITSSDCPATEPREVLTRAEVKLMINTPCSNKEVYNAFIYCCLTGLRTSEARVHSPADLKIIGERVYIDIAQKKGMRPKPKLIPLKATTMKYLGNYTPGSKEPFFKLPSQNGTNKMIKGWLKQCGITKHITFYCARHTFGTELMAAKTDPITAAGMLGHSSLKHLRRYAHEVDANKEAAIDQLDYEA